MGQEESTGGTASDLSDAARFVSENQTQYEMPYNDIYSRQNYSNKISYDNFVKKSKISDNDQFLIDNFYVEILKHYNQKILEASHDPSNNNSMINENSNHSQLSKYEIEQLNHETDEIYNHTLPGLNADINNLKDLFKIKQKKDISRNQKNEDIKFFCPDCSALDS